MRSVGTLGAEFLRMVRTKGLCGAAFTIPFVLGTYYIYDRRILSDLIFSASDTVLLFA